ncbi:MAG: alanine racemase [Paracoccaceae bacterium]|jgi:alanine racemase|nr:alanine racemase [Paracoccaceae bacterium]
MATATLTIDLNALVENWQTLNAKSAENVETAAVVKANGYGLDAGRVAQTLQTAGVKTFFVAAAEEGIAVRKAIGSAATINVFSGHMAGDKTVLTEYSLVPMLNSPDQIHRHFADLPNHPFGVQLDTGMNRLGLEPSEWSDARRDVLARSPTLLMSHLACADTPDHPMNQQQLAAFREMTDGLNIRRSFAATGGTLNGAEFHFDLTRPGVGLYGGIPFGDAKPVAHLDIPVIQTRLVNEGETVGYSNTWTAQRPSRIATVAAGYADGLIRAMGADLTLWAGDQKCRVVGRISMDMIGVDVTDLGVVPDSLSILNDHQTVDALADAAGTIGYEILTSLGGRYKRVYLR